MDDNNPTDIPVLDPMPELVRKILDLQYRIDHLDEQNWYFVGGLEHNKSKLADLKHQYHKIMESVNSHDLNFYISEVNEGRKKDLNVRLGMGMAERLSLFKKVRKLKWDEEDLIVKQKYGTLKNIEDEDMDRFFQ